MMNSSDFEIIFKNCDLLTPDEIEQSYQLRIEMYPKFKEQYEKNRCFSFVRPRELLLVYDRDFLAATGKLVEKKVACDTLGVLTFYGFGFLIRTAFQKQGLGKRIFGAYLERAKELGGDLLFGTSEHPAILSVATKYHFKVLTTQLVYHNTFTNKESSYKKEFPHMFVFGYEFKPGIIDQINTLPSLHIGDGPV